MNLFQSGSFTLNSGARSLWKLECDALTDADIRTLATMIRQLVGPFRSVEGVPRGGLRLETELHNHMLCHRCRNYRFTHDQPFTHPFEMDANDIRGPHLIVDDVLTTGGSMERLRAERQGVVGAVIFARGPCPSWIKPLFQMPQELWIGDRS